MVHDTYLYLLHVCTYMFFACRFDSSAVSEKLPMTVNFPLKGEQSDNSSGGKIYSSLFSLFVSSIETPASSHGNA